MTTDTALALPHDPTTPTVSLVTALALIPIHDPAQPTVALSQRATGYQRGRTP